MFPTSVIKSGKYLFHSGFLISFLGSLPPGMTNVITIQLAISGQYLNAAWFALGTVIAEVIYAKICLAMINQIFRFEFIIKMLRWFVLVALSAMAITSFIAFAKGWVHSTGDLIAGDESAFISGFLLMAINPVQIPFWLGWTTILVERKIQVFSPQSQTAYLSGIGLGSLLASATFIAGGQFLFNFLPSKGPQLHFVFGCAFAIMALMQGYKLLVEKVR
jgi:threonine/homoserine/homoserine lactone efflux protein